MARKKQWRSRADVMQNFVGEDSSTLEEDNRRFSHRVYKSTDCGAWCNFVEPDKSPQAGRGAYCRKWRATLQCGINGVHAHSIRPVGGKPVTSLPKHVRDFLTLPDRGSKTTLSCEALAALKPDESLVGGGVLKVSGKGIRRTVTFVACPPKKSDRRGGVVCGSIVEGSDAEVGPFFVSFPLTPEQFDRTLTNICDEVTPLWEEANRSGGDDLEGVGCRRFSGRRRRR